MAKMPSGFGEGIHDDDAFEFIDDSPILHNDFDIMDDRVVPTMIATAMMIPANCLVNR